jgi:phosphatidylglycerophosphate synthase
MTSAVIFTAGGPPGPGADVVGPAGRLAAQLRAAGAETVWVIARPDQVNALCDAGLAVISCCDPADDLRAVARLALESTGPLLVCAGDLVANDGVLLALAAAPAGRSSALVGAGTASAPYPRLREERGQVAAVLPTGEEASDRYFLGALRVDAVDREEFAERCVRAAERPASDPRAGAVDLLLPELAGGTTLGACRVRLLHAERVTDAAGFAAARAAVAAVDEDAVRLKLSVKERDDFFTTYFVSSWSPLVTRWAARLGLTPTAVTAGSTFLALVAAGAFTVGSRPALIIGAVLLYLGFVLDCVDGQLARYTGNFSPFGGWLDTMADRAKEYVVYAGLAAGAVRSGLGDVWPLAVAAIALQTVRHMTDAWYGALHDKAVARRSAAVPAQRSAEPVLPSPGAPAAAAVPRPRAGLGVRLGQVSERVQSQTGSVAYWLKRIVVFPIGERWALIALTAALFNGRVALLAVLAWGGSALAYTLALRTLRSRAMRVPVLAGTDAASHRDDGPLARRVLGALGARSSRPLPLAALAVLFVAGFVAAHMTGAVDVASARRWIPVDVGLALVAALAAGAPQDGSLDWLVPGALRAVEYLAVIAIGIGYNVPLPAVFGLLFALAMHHYNLTARMEKHQRAPRFQQWALGWDGRLVLLAVLAAAGAPYAAIVSLAGYLVVVFCVGVFFAWWRRTDGRER